MRVVLLLLVLSLGIFMRPADAQQSEIQSVISDQIEAFKADDFATAFTFAHPNIQGIFQTPENFGRMVTQGYPMVWRPADVTYLPLREDAGSVLQDVQVTDLQGRVFVLEYTMVETPNGWRIGGVRILERSAVSA